MHIHRIPAEAIGLRHFFCLPWLQTECWPAVHNRWICKSFRRWQGWLVFFELPSANAHLRRSAKLLVGSSLKSVGVVRVEDALSNEQEFSSLIVGVTIILAAWAADWQKGEGSGASVASSSASLLGRVVRLCLGDEALSFTCDGLPRAAQVFDGKVLVGSWARDAPVAARYLGIDGDIPVSDMMVAICRRLRTQSRAAPSTVGFLKAFLRGIVDLISTRFELLVAPKCTSGSLVALPTLRLRDGGRPRRISTARKRALSMEVHSGSGMKKLSDFAAAEGTLARARGDAAPVKPRSARNFSVSILYQYWVCSRKHWSSRQHIHLSCDAGRVSGDDLLMTVMFSPESEKANWSAPQAPT